MSYLFTQVSIALLTEKNEEFHCKIKFNYNDFAYELTALHLGKEWSVIYIGHGKEEKNEANCPFCQKPMNLYTCPALEEKKEKVFEALINHPQIRTRWLLQTI